MTSGGVARGRQEMTEDSPPLFYSQVSRGGARQNADTWWPERARSGVVGCGRFARLPLVGVLFPGPGPP